MMKYLEVEKLDENFYIKGYPNAVHLGNISNDSDAAELLDLALHQADITHCVVAIEWLMDDAFISSDSFLVQSVWLACIGRFFKCFGKSKARKQLSIHDIVANEPLDARRVFDYFKALRNKHLIHDENAYSQGIVGVVVNAPDASIRIADIVTSVTTSRTDDQEHIRAFGQLVACVNLWLGSRREEIHQILARRYENYEYEDLLKLPSPVYKAPLSNEVFTKR